MLMKTEAYDNITTELQEVGWGSMDCLDMDQERDRGQLKTGQLLKKGSAPWSK